MKKKKESSKRRKGNQAPVIAIIQTVLMMRIKIGNRFTKTRRKRSKNQVVVMRLMRKGLRLSKKGKKVLIVMRIDIKQRFIKTRKRSINKIVVMILRMKDGQENKKCQIFQIVTIMMINLDLRFIKTRRKRFKNKIVVMILRMKDDQENKKCQIVLIVIVKKNEGKPTKIKKIKGQST